MQKENALLACVQSTDCVNTMSILHDTEVTYILRPFVNKKANRFNKSL